MLVDQTLMTWIEFQAILHSIKTFAPQMIELNDFRWRANFYGPRCKRMFIENSFTFNKGNWNGFFADITLLFRPGFLALHSWNAKIQYFFEIIVNREVVKKILAKLLLVTWQQNRLSYGNRAFHVFAFN